MLTVFSPKVCLRLKAVTFHIVVSICEPWIASRCWRTVSSCSRCVIVWQWLWVENGGGNGATVMATSDEKSIAAWETFTLEPIGSSQAAAPPYSIILRFPAVFHNFALNVLTFDRCPVARDIGLCIEDLYKFLTLVASDTSIIRWYGLCVGQCCTVLCAFRKHSL